MHRKLLKPIKEETKRTGAQRRHTEPYIFKPGNTYFHSPEEKKE